MKRADFDEFKPEQIDALWEFYQKNKDLEFKRLDVDALEKYVKKSKEKENEKY
jgi:hypothetical protein